MVEALLKVLDQGQPVRKVLQSAETDLEIQDTP